MTGSQTGDILRQVHRLVAPRRVGQLSDCELLQRFARERDEEAFAALLRRHGPLVFGACWRVLHNPHDAEDVFQATFLVLARKAAALPWRGSVGPWLHEVAARL